MLNVDLHSHSTSSDGLLPAADVARRASANGVDLMALTDHDSLSGLPAARAVADELGMRFVNGVEVSIEWGGLQVHILGFAFDADDAALNEWLEAIRSGRIDRARRMAADLEKIGIGGAFDGAERAHLRRIRRMRSISWTGFGVEKTSPDVSNWSTSSSCFFASCVCPTSE